MPKVLYLQGQRWGSALPAPAAVYGRDANGGGPTTATVCGVRYERETLPLLYKRPSSSSTASSSSSGGSSVVVARRDDYLADDEMGLYYAGDFCSSRCPGFEAAALSAIDVAEHILSGPRLAGRS